MGKIFMAQPNIVVGGQVRAADLLLIEKRMPATAIDVLHFLRDLPIGQPSFFSMQTENGDLERSVE